MSKFNILNPEPFTKGELKALEAENLPAFSGIKLLHVKKEIAAILNRIGQNGIFEEYTKHDISHVNGMLLFLEWLIPEETQEIMTSSDWLMIVLAIYFHDLGMLVTKQEYENRYGNSLYVSFKENILNGNDIEYKEKILNLSNSDQEIFLYQEFVRSKHAERVHIWIEDDVPNSYYNNLSVVKEIKKILEPLGTLFRRDLAIVCESHNLNDLTNFNKYKIKQKYGQYPEESVNLHYAALILRTADLLHINSTRTPTIEYLLINPSDPISQEEWSKQKAVKSVEPKELSEIQETNNLLQDTITVTAYFEDHRGFFALTSYLNYVREQLYENYNINQIATKDFANKYIYPWKYIDDSAIETKNFEKIQFEFTLDQNRILDLLVGHTLYNDSTVVLRELAQNSIDATKLQQYIYEEKSIQTYIPEILVEYFTQEHKLIFSDNGTGMTLDIIKKYLLTAGSSYYQSQTFKEKFVDFNSISRFGIGLLTCFLIANDIDIITKHYDSDKAIMLCIRKVHGKFLLKYLSISEINPLIKEHGTQIVLYLRKDIQLGNIEKKLNKWVLFPLCKFTLKIDESSNPVGYFSPKEFLEKNLPDNNSNYSVKVEEVSLDSGITLAYALKYNEYFDEWDFLECSISSNDDDDSEDEKNVLPIGICIEGIRVDFNSPGFESKKICAIANVYGKSAPRTDIARSRIEKAEGRDNLLLNIYNLYLDHFKQEFTRLSDNTSPSWAISEYNYLIDDFLTDANELSKIDILKKSLSRLKCILKEEGDKRIPVSLEELKKDKTFWTIDCRLFSSADSLMREIPSISSMSSISLVEKLCLEQSQIKHIDRLLCNFWNNANLVRDIIKEQFQVTKIKLIPEFKRVDMQWSVIEKKIWESFIVDIDYEPAFNRYYQRPGKICFIQIGDIEIENTDKHIAIFTNKMFFLLKGSDIHNYLSGLMALLNIKESKEGRLLFVSILSFVIKFFKIKTKNIETLNRNYEYLFEDADNRFSDYAKEKINKDELLNLMLKVDLSKFDASLLYRKDEEYFI